MCWRLASEPVLYHYDLASFRHLQIVGIKLPFVLGPSRDALSRAQIAFWHETRNRIGTLGKGRILQSATALLSTKVLVLVLVLREDLAMRIARGLHGRMSELENRMQRNARRLLSTHKRNAT